MSTLYLATDVDALAGKLAEHLEAKDRDPFVPATIVVPNRYLGKWLRLWLARRLGLAFNLRFLYLENALWEWLRRVDPRQHSSEPELLDHDSYRLMILSILWEDNADPKLAAVQGYVRTAGPATRASWRRSWHLADRLARSIRDYEYHRQDALIQHWLKGELGYPNAGPGTVRQERTQLEIFRRITRPLDGKRALLEQATGRILKTLPQYAMEVMEFAGPPASETKDMVHLFAITQISALHMRTLSWLSGTMDVRLYHLNPLAAILNTEPGAPATGSPAPRWWVESWGKAGIESHYLAEQLLSPPSPFQCEYVESSRKDVSTVLGRFQASIFDPPSAIVNSQLQDKSIQIVACPGIYREVEAVYQSILHNLQKNPELKQTDIGVLVTDMSRYRPVLQAVFERVPGRLHYNLASFSAAGLSVFGQALLGILDLALESFTKAQVFAVLLNPCVLARYGVDRNQALTWLDWAQKLGIYHGWDRQDKEQRGYPATRQFSWRRGLQRLRLGRIMEVAPEDDDVPAPRFQDVIPYADLASGDKEQLNAFCRVVEGLLPCLTRLRNYHGTGGQWAGEIRRLVQHFLAVPDDAPEEEQVRDRLLWSLSHLEHLDRLQAPGLPPVKLPLALVREFVQENLETLEGTKGEFLTGGVTIAPMQAIRFVPFRILYTLGLGEDLFPGSNALPSLDLRDCERRRGDIHPAENNRFLFLESLLAARDKVYLLYNNRDLQRDQDLQPAVPLMQLRCHLEEHLLGKKFEEVKLPLNGSSPKYLEQATDHADVLVNYNETERLLALEEARSLGILDIDEPGMAEIQRRLKTVCPDFRMPDGPGQAPQTTAPTITVRELKHFLLSPAEACLKRILRMEDEKDSELQDDEPFWTDALGEHQLVTDTLERFVHRAIREGVDAARATWQSGFAQRYEEWCLRSRAPEGAFAEVDRAGYEAALEERINSTGGLADFLRQRSANSFAGPILLGESTAPVGARWHFPALTLEIGQNLYGPAQVRLVGSCRLVWRTPKAFEILVLTNKKPTNKILQTEISKYFLEPVLFWLALRTGKEIGQQGISSNQWLEELPLRVYLIHQEGIASFTYKPGDINLEKARDYLIGLAMDLLHPNSFDLLPLEILISCEDFRKAYQVDQRENLKEPEHFQRRLQDFLDEEREKEGFSTYRWSALVDLAGAKVPADALTKVRRRFRILDRGPRRNRPREDSPVYPGGKAGAEKPRRSPTH
jgi:exonuclease V gamma subunit